MENNFKDKSIKCVDCGDEFVFSANEQAFYAEKGFTNEPRRCKACRDKKKASRPQTRRENNWNN